MITQRQVKEAVQGLKAQRAAIEFNAEGVETIESHHLAVAIELMDAWLRWGKSGHKMKEMK